MSFCTKCGAKVGETSKFCPACGNPMQASPAGTPVGRSAVESPNMQGNAPPITRPRGAILLKVTGIIMIVLSALEIIVWIAVAIAMSVGVSLIGSSIVGLSYLFSGVPTEVMAVLGIFIALAIGKAIVELVTGILGTANSKNVEKAKTCMAWGIVDLVLSIGEILFFIVIAIIGASLGVAMGGEVGIFVRYGLLPILYIIGAARLAKQKAR